MGEFRTFPKGGRRYPPTRRTPWLAGSNLVSTKPRAGTRCGHRGDPGARLRMLKTGPVPEYARLRIRGTPSRGLMV
jgi:hypothetical protein